MQAQEKEPQFELLKLFKYHTEQREDFLNVIEMYFQNLEGVVFSMDQLNLEEDGTKQSKDIYLGLLSFHLNKILILQRSAEKNESDMLGAVGSKFLNSDLNEIRDFEVLRSLMLLGGEMTQTAVQKLSKSLTAVQSYQLYSGELSNQQLIEVFQEIGQEIVGYLRSNIEQMHHHNSHWRTWMAACCNSLK
ncbi:hypothetical protein [Thiosulfativibrio zosterae]|uniref:Uncharacterized protein n=1 Tax=Thiosulfativibrio zosterae TaxID=2675053 RepID=A0A6F8PR48_9GAMM|nr:hypothetical protein [Thiosulfativibrio zosterae]BBP44603.1 hypothetical protein THMIRHAT_23490 [Thiosulfativibrio zosterae]